MLSKIKQLRYHWIGPQGYFQETHITLIYSQIDNLGNWIRRESLRILFIQIVKISSHKIKELILIKINSF